MSDKASTASTPVSLSKGEDAASDHRARCASHGLAAARQQAQKAGMSLSRREGLAWAVGWLEDGALTCRCDPPVPDGGLVTADDISDLCVLLTDVLLRQIEHGSRRSDRAAIATARVSLSALRAALREREWQTEAIAEDGRLGSECNGSD